MSEAQEAQVVVIGGGPGGYVAAIRAAQLGLKTILVEAAELGGVCLNWGCIPTKALLRNAEVMHLVRRGKDWGIKVTGYEVDWKAVVRRSRQVAQRLSKGVAFLLKKNGVVHLNGRGRLLEGRRVEVIGPDGSRQEVRAEAVILATGARPRPLPGVAFDGQRILTARDALLLEEIPGRFLVVGAGPIGLEFAQIYGDFGSEITIVEMLPRILPPADEEVSELLARIFRKRGWTLHTGATVTSLAREGEEVVCQVTKGEQTLELRADVALVAIGVQGNVEDLGLETVGIRTERSFVPTGPHMETNVPGYYAIGDLTGPPALAHVASAQGIIAAERIAGREPALLDLRRIPACTYCRPEVASLGLTEAQAREQGLEFRVGRFPFRANGRSLSHGESEGFVKILFGEPHGEILGAHLVGPEVTELLAELGLAASAELTRHEILGTVHAHPTLSEAILEATGEAYGEAIHI
jgi:dihydrolipoamide dehydrogenase